MIRQSIARQLGPHGHEAVPGLPLTLVTHASQYRYALPESGGPCLIEPTVACNHCGYCQSHGY
ncbi:MAG: hypothetical protein ABIP65_04265 [Vicinamibacterales bacterium]